MVSTDYSGDKKWAKRAFIFGVTWLTYANSLNMLITTVIGNNPYDTLFSNAIAGLCTLMYFRTNGMHLRRDILGVFAFSMTLINLDRFHPHTLPSATTQIIDGFLKQGFLGYFFARMVTNENSIYKCLKSISLILFISACIIPFAPSDIAKAFGGESAGTYGAYMLFGARMMPAAVMLIYLSKKEKNWIYKGLAITAVIELLLFANRGAIVSVILFYIVYELLFNRKRAKLRIIGSILPLLILYLLITSEFGNRFIIDLTRSLNIESRNFERLLANTLGDTGRNDVYTQAVQYISENWIFGVGLSGSWRYGYPHNIFYEILEQFGVVLGSGIILYAGYHAGRILLNRYCQLIGEEFLVFFCAGFVPLLFSGSYMISWMFWVLAGIFVTLNRRLRELKDD